MQPQDQDHPNTDKMSLHPHETTHLLRDSVSDAVLPSDGMNGSPERTRREHHGSVSVTRIEECQRPEETSDTQEGLGLEEDRDHQSKRGIDVEKSHSHLDEQSSSRPTVARTQTMPSGYTFTYANSSSQPSSSSLSHSPSSSLQRGASSRIPRYARRSRDYFVPTLTCSVSTPTSSTVSRSTTLPVHTTGSDHPDAAPVPSTNVDPITSATPPTAPTTTHTPTVPISLSSSSSSSSSCYSPSPCSSKSGSPTLSPTSIPNLTPTLTLTATSTSPPTHAIDSSVLSSNTSVPTTSNSMDSTAPSSSAVVKPPTPAKTAKAGPNAKAKASGSSSVVAHGFPLHATTYTKTSPSPPVPSKAGISKPNPKSKSTTSLPLSGTLSNPIGSTSTSSLTMTLHRPTSPLANSFTPDDVSVSSRGSIDDSQRGQRDEKGCFGFGRTRSKSTGESRKSVVEDDEKASSSGHGSVGHGNGLSAHPAAVPSVKTHQFATSHPPFRSLSSALASASKAPTVLPPTQASSSKASSRTSSRTSSTATLPLPSSSTSTPPLPPLPKKSSSHSQSTTYRGYAGGSIYGEGYGGTNNFPRMPTFMQKPTEDEDDDDKEVIETGKHEAGSNHQRARSEPGHDDSSSTSHRTSPSVSNSQYYSIPASPQPSSSPFRASSITPSPSPSTTPSNTRSRTLSSPSATQPTTTSPQIPSQTYSSSYSNSYTSFSSSPPPLPKPLHIRTQVHTPQSFSSCETSTISPSSPTSPGSRRPLPTPPSASSTSNLVTSVTDSPSRQPQVAQAPLLTQLVPVQRRETSQPSAYYTPNWSPHDHSPLQVLSASMASHGSRPRGGGIEDSDRGTRPSLPPLNREISQGSAYYTPTWSPYSPSAAEVRPTAASRTPSYSHSRTWSQPNAQGFVGGSGFGITNYAQASYTGGSSGFGTSNGGEYFPPAHQPQHQQQTSGSGYLGGHLRTWSQPHPYSFSHPNPRSYLGHTRGYSEPRSQESFNRPKTYADEDQERARRDAGRLSLGISLWDDDEEESESGSGRSFHTASSDEAESREERGSDDAREEEVDEDAETTTRKAGVEEEALTYSYAHLIPGFLGPANPSSQHSQSFGSVPSSTYTQQHAPKTPPRKTEQLPVHVQLKTPPRHSHSSSSSPPRHNSSSHTPTQKSYGWADKFPLPPSTTPTSVLGGFGGSTSLSPRSRYAPLPSPGSPNRTMVSKTTTTPTKSTFGAQGLVAETVSSMGSEVSKISTSARNSGNEGPTSGLEMADVPALSKADVSVSSSAEEFANGIQSDSSMNPAVQTPQIEPQSSTKRPDSQAQDIEVAAQPSVVPILASPPKFARPNPSSTLSPALPPPLNPQPTFSKEEPPHSSHSTTSSPLSTLLPYPPGLTPPHSAQPNIPSFGSAVTAPAVTTLGDVLDHSKIPVSGPSAVSTPLIPHHQHGLSHDKEVSESSSNNASNPASNPSTFGFSATNPYIHAQYPSNATTTSPSRSGPGSRSASFVLISGAKFVDEIKDDGVGKAKDRGAEKTTELEKGRTTSTKAGDEEMVKEEDMEGYEPQWPMRYLTSTGDGDVDEMGVKTAKRVDDDVKNRTETTKDAKKNIEVEEVVKKKGRKWTWRRSSVVVDGPDLAKDKRNGRDERSRGLAEELFHERPAESAEVESKGGVEEPHRKLANEPEAEVHPLTEDERFINIDKEEVTGAPVDTEQHLRPQSQRLSLISRISRRISMKKDDRESKRRSRTGFEEGDVNPQQTEAAPKENEVPKKHAKLRKKRRYSYAHVFPMSQRTSVLQEDPQAQHNEDYARIVAEEVEGVSGTSDGYVLLRQGSRIFEGAENGMGLKGREEEQDDEADYEAQQDHNNVEERARTRSISSSTSTSRLLPVPPTQPPIRPLPQSQSVPHTPPLQHLSLNLSLNQHEHELEVEDQDVDDEKRGSAMVEVSMDVDAVLDTDDCDGDDDVDENDFSFVNPIQLLVASDQPEPAAGETVQGAADEWEDVPFSEEGALFVNISPGAGSRDEVEPFVEHYAWTVTDDDTDYQLSNHQEETRRRIEEMLRSKGLDVVYEEDEEDEEHGWVEDDQEDELDDRVSKERRTLKSRESYPHLRDKGKAKARGVAAQETNNRRGPKNIARVSLGSVESARYAGGYGDRGVVLEDDYDEEVVEEEYEVGDDEDEEMEMEIFEDALEPIEEEPDLEEQAHAQDQLSGLIGNVTSDATPFDFKRHQPSSHHYHQNHLDDQQPDESSALDTYSKPSDHERPLTPGDATESITPTMTLTPASSMMLLKNPLTTTTTTVSPATTIAAVTPVLSAQILKDSIPPLPAGAAHPVPGAASYALHISTSMNPASTSGTSTPTQASSTPASKLTPLRRVPKSRSGSSLRQMRVGGSRESLRDRMGTVASKRSPKVSRERLRTPKGSKEGLRTPTGSREGLRETRRSDISGNGKTSRKDQKKRKMLVKAKSAKSSVAATSSSTLKGKERESQVAESSQGRSQSKSSSSKKAVKKPSQVSLRANRRPTSSGSTPKSFLGSLRISLLRPIHLVFGTNRKRLSKELRTPNTLVQNRRFSEKYIPRFPSRLDGIRGVEKRVAKYK